MLNSPSGVNPRSFKKKRVNPRKGPIYTSRGLQGLKNGTLAPCSHIRCMNQDGRTIPMSQAKRLSALHDQHYAMYVMERLRLWAKELLMHLHTWLVSMKLRKKRFNCL